ncbi:MAG: glycosyltransferase family 4 protein [Pelolinea sp.]|nr:glycosyltransferase family 4 protein [Pelolinea sp.]
MVVSHLATELIRHGHEVMIGTNRYPHSLPETERIEDIEVRRYSFIEPEWAALRNHRMDLFGAGLWFKYATTWQMDQWIRDFRPDMVNFHYLGAPAGFLYRTWQKQPFPLVVSLHGGDVTGEPAQSRRKRERFDRVTNAANAVTACSHALATQAEALNPVLTGKIQVIHNGVDSDRFIAAKPNDLGFPYVLGVGQLSEHKGFDLLIRGFASIAEQYPKVNLVIAGDGNQRDILEGLAAEKGVKERVVFTGKIDENTVASLMKGCLFLAVPSRKEPFGIVALEGMAAGKIVLATQVGGIPEFLPVPPNAFVLPDASSWKRALGQALPLSLAGQLDGSKNQDAAARFSWQNLADAYLRVYEEALCDFKNIQ